jgi:hypothetical protein
MLLNYIIGDVSVLKAFYCIVVSGTFDRDPIECKEYPTEDQILQAIKDQGGETARVEKRYKIIS